MMIQINKGTTPQVLVDNCEDWKNELMQYIHDNKPIPKATKNRYNRKEVKEALKEECMSKCMYCESPISHITAEHIEHIKPKAKDKFPELTFNWDNLGLSCPQCNINKGDYYDTNDCLVNPYQEPPSDYLLAIGNFLYPKSSNGRGEATITILQLNRPPLLEQRQQRLKSIERLISLFHKQKNASIQDALRKEIEIEIERNKPYSFIANSFVSQLI